MSNESAPRGINPETLRSQAEQVLLTRGAEARLPESRRGFSITDSYEIDGIGQYEMAITSSRKNPRHAARITISTGRPEQMILPKNGDPQLRNGHLSPPTDEAINHFANAVEIMLKRKSEGKQ